jgi:hypothetical protein
VAPLVAGAVADADLEHVVGKLVEAILVQVGAMPAERIGGRLTRQPDERLAAQPVRLERLGRSLYDRAYRPGM